MTATITEAAYQQRIVDLCRWLGLAVFHSGDSRRDLCAGFPDLVIAGNGVIFAELKRDDGRLRPEQTEWLRILHAAGVEAHVWKPADWPEVERRLRELATAPDERGTA